MTGRVGVHAEVVAWLEADVAATAAAAPAGTGPVASRDISPQ
ncbi:MAG TPA: hypothetical protein VFJ07_25510 [Streptosporangiaceae bacterium]|nr:hypothetical protein [Streptosporangiaceae bacterium]